MGARTWIGSWPAVRQLAGTEWLGGPQRERLRAGVSPGT